MPETIAIPPDKVEAFVQFAPVLNRLGIECELFGENHIIVRALPAILSRTSAEHIFEDLFAISGWGDWGANVDRRWDDAIARLACHGSVRSGRDLERDEVYALLRSLEEAEASAFCPHGRPVVVYLAASELEALFGRS